MHILSLISPCRSIYLAYLISVISAHIAGHNGNGMFTFSSAFAKFKKARISVFMAVSPFSWNKSDSTAQIFMLFELCVKIIQVLLKSNKNNGYFT